ncbi:MAG TPA: FdhF/YdeP family oxidoreductase [Myxococcota bacterium]|jgi:molybdopterin-dependent oxidoreductase alpha subunit
MAEEDDRSGPGPAAGGLAAIVSTLKTVGLANAGRGLRALARMNQPGGFDCPGCAWPEPHEHGAIEFCENGAKAVAHEATRRRVGRELLARTPVAELLAHDDHWLEAQGRLVEPLVRRAGARHLEPIGWDEAYTKAAAELRALASPDQAVFYTSGRASNEAAFLWQLFARQLGTNNLPDCSNLCHESSGEGLGEAIGVGKGTVSLADIENAGAIFVIGQNPGTNHPRMLTTLAAAKRRGARIVAINPLRERGLVRFAQPQDPLALLGRSAAIADLYLQVRVGGDVALLKGIMKELLEAEARDPGRVLDWPFIRRHTEGFAELSADLAAQRFPELEARSGIPRRAMREAAEIYAAADGVVACWAMGITQHRHGVANVQEILNLLLLRGNLGRPGAGPCPVRGHSNVQGDRTVGITERPGAAFLARLAAEFEFAPPREPGFDTVAAIRALRDGRVHVFLALGGNFAVATPDTAATAAALGRCRLAVQIATTLNRTALLAGREALLLPCLARSERDLQAGGEQFVTVEDSMSVVHASRGGLEPASAALRSEPAIVAGLAAAALGERSRVPWPALLEDYDRIRDRMARVLPGFEDYARRARAPGGFLLPSGARERRFETPSGRALFRVHPLPEDSLAPGRFLLTTIRSHDQFNTTVYGFDDRLRGLRGDRRVVLLHADDIAAAGLRAGQGVDLTSHFRGETRTLRGFRVVAYDLPRRCAAAYFPEANGLVPLESQAERSHTPAYKSIEISLTPGEKLV